MDEGYFYQAEYTPNRDKTLWDAVVDRVLPPIVDANGCEVDEDYWERILYHVFHIGGPEAGWNPEYQPRRLWALLDRRDAFLERVQERREELNARWTAYYTQWDDWWFDKKHELRQTYGRKWLCGLCLTTDDDEEAQQPFLYDARQGHYGTFSPCPTSDQRTPLLLQHASLYTEVSEHCYNQDPDVEESGNPIIVSTTSSPPRSSPTGSSPPSALSGKKGFLRILPTPWKPKRSVRFNGVQDFLVYDKLPGEPTGCYKPDYSHLIDPRPDPQVDVIISVLHAVSSSSRQTSTRIPPRPYQFHASRDIICNA